MGAVGRLRQCSLGWVNGALVALVVASVFISGCVSSVSLRPYNDPGGLYSFSYPNGMVEVEVGANQEPIRLLFHDLIMQTENVNLMVSPYTEADQITDVGTPAEVGARVADKILAPEGSGRTATLLKAGQLDTEGHSYYLLEYETQVGPLARHDMLAVTIQRNELYTLVASTSQERWPEVKETFYAVAQSLRVA